MFVLTEKGRVHVPTHFRTVTKSHDELWLIKSSPKTLNK